LCGRLSDPKHHARIRVLEVRNESLLLADGIWQCLDSAAVSSDGAVTDTGRNVVDYDRAERAVISPWLRRGLATRQQKTPLVIIPIAVAFVMLLVY
jgi:hypothetical protein